MRTKVVIFGTGSFAELVHYYLSRDERYEVVAFCAHRDRLPAGAFCGLPVVAFEDVDTRYPAASHEMFVAVGYRKVNQIRAGIYHQAKAKGYSLLTYVSPHCVNLATAIGDNCFVFEDNTLQPFVTIGNNVILWSGNHIGHHSSIGDHCFVASHVVVAGHCRIEALAFLGINATVRDGVTIGESCIIGAGSLIMKSTKAMEVYLAERTKRFAKRSDEIDF